LKVARIFPSKTKFSPTDQDAYFDEPGLFTPYYDFALISVAFTWDKVKAQRLAEAWKNNASTVKIGGPAIDGESREPFSAGKFLKQGITITSRGCDKVGWGPGYCKNCRVSKGIIEFDDFPAGNILQDNNFIQCSDNHIGKVLSMLETQHRIKFAGGLDKYLLTKKFASAIKGLSIEQIFLACDNTKEIGVLEDAVAILNEAGFNQHKIYCYTVVGKDMQKEENRCRRIYEAGATPFAQLYRDPEGKIKYSQEYKLFACAWSRPAIINTRAKNNWPQIKHHSAFKRLFN